MLFFHLSHHMSARIISFYEEKKDNRKLTMVKLRQKIKPKLSGGMNGFAYISDKTVQLSEIYSSIDGMETIIDNRTIFVYYKGPPAHPHIPRIPKGATLPKKLISKKDVIQAPTLLWHEKTAVLGRLHCSRPIPKAVAGHHLAKLSCQLITHHYYGSKPQQVRKENRKQNQNLGKRKRVEEYNTDRVKRGKGEKAEGRPWNGENSPGKASKSSKRRRNRAITKMRIRQVHQDSTASAK